MESKFDQQEAKKFLLERAQREKQEREDVRQKTLQRAITVLRERFQGSGIDVYLVGSILRPYHFTPSSDIDIVVKNFTGDRFQLWTELEDLLQRDVEVILFESCHFKEFVTKEGLKVV
jgi:predicted nucleotidyltransferase